MKENNKNDLENLLKNEKNPLKIFADINFILQYITTYEEFYDLVTTFLNDNQKLKLFEFSYIQKCNKSIKVKLLMLILDETVLLQGLKDESITSNFTSWDIMEIIENKSDKLKKEVLYIENIANKLSPFYITQIIASMGNTIKYDILLNKQLLYEELKLYEFDVVELIKTSDFEDGEKQHLINNIYSFLEHNRVQILKTLSDNNKEKELLGNYHYNKYSKIEILQSFEIEFLIGFINRHRNTFFTDISIYSIIIGLDVEHQLEFISKLEKVNLTENEKKEIFAVLKKDTKAKLDISTLTPPFKKAVSVETDESTGKVVLDLDRDLEDYRGLDSLLYVNPTRFVKEDRDKFLILCSICPNLTVLSTLNSKADDKKIKIELPSTAMDYKIAEEWVQNLLNSLKPEYTFLQKMAVIDNAIGGRISYSPDFDTEVGDPNGSRALYKIFSTGYGVCNGVARAEEYVFNRAGMECEIVGSKTHAFLKFKDVEFELDDGETIRGTTILDPTWNLTAHRFHGRPNYFCISYEEARKCDIDIEGKDHECHKNDEELKDATFNLDDMSLRKLFKSVGLADENGNFPIKFLIDQSEQLHKKYANQPEKNIEEQFSLLSKFCPEFVTCQVSTMKILADVLLNDESLKYSNCIVNRVYNKLDTKKDRLYLYI